MDDLMLGWIYTSSSYPMIFTHTTHTYTYTHTHTHTHTHTPSSHTYTIKKTRIITYPRLPLSLPLSLPLLPLK